MDEDLEPVDDGNVVDAPTDGGAGGPDEPVARADETGDPAPPSAPSIDWDDPQVQERVAHLSQQQTLSLLERLGVVSFDTPHAEGPPAPDPLSDTYPQDLERYIEAKLAAQNEPIQQYFEAQRAAEVDNQIGGLLDKTITDMKIERPADPAQAEQFDSAFRALADSFAPVAASRFGATPRAAQEAARMAGEWLVARDKASGEASVLNYRKQIGEIQDTPAEPGAGGGGGLGIEAKPKTYDEILEHHLGSLS